MTRNDPGSYQENKKGRPTKFSLGMLPQIAKLAQRGWTDQEMADFFQVSRSTWNLWKIKHPKFSDALKGWKKEADDRVERSLYERAIGYTHIEEKIFCNKDGEVTVVETHKHYPPDTTACIYWLKNRQPDKWRDRRGEEMQVNPEDTAARIRELVQRIDESIPLVGPTKRE